MLKIFADECITQDIVIALRDQGLDILTAREAGLIGADDDAIFDFALKDKRILLTFDREFGNIFRFSINKSAGVVIILIGQMSKEETINIPLNFFSFAKSRDLKSKLVIIGKTRIRISKRR